MASAGTTVTTQTALTLLYCSVSWVVAVMIAVPSSTAVMRPVVSPTVATASGLLEYVTVSPAGSGVAVLVTVPSLFTATLP